MTYTIVEEATIIVSQAVIATLETALFHLATTKYKDPITLQQTAFAEKSIQLHVFTLAKRSAVPSGAFGEFLSASTVMIISTDVNIGIVAMKLLIVARTRDVKRAMVFASSQVISLRCELCLDN